MNNSLEFLYFVYSVSIVILSVSLFVSVFLNLIPLVREVRVKNGLIPLRKLLFTKGLVKDVIQFVALLALTSRFYLEGEIIRYVTVSLVFLFCLGFLILSLLDRQIYKLQFNERQKILHEKIAKLEEKRDDDVTNT